MYLTTNGYNFGFCNLLAYCLAESFAKILRAALDKFMQGEVAANARVQVILPNGEFYDITGVKLLENKLIGVRESHRLAITISPEQWKMGKVIKKL
jgi:hypothetical protein